MKVLKIIFLFLTIFFSIVNFARIGNKKDVPCANFILQTIGIVGFIVLQFNMI